MGKRIALLFFIFFCTNTVLLSFVLRSETPFELSMWASGILWLNIIPIIHYLAIGHKKEIFPYMPILGFFTSLSYALPVFFIKPSSYEVAPLSATALAYAFFGYLIFYFSYCLTYNLFRFRKGYNVIELPDQDVRIRVLAFIFLAIYLFARKIYKVPSLVYVGDAGIYIFFGTYLFLIGKKIKISIGERLVFYCVLAEEFLAFFISGQFAGLALFILYFCIILFITGRGFKKIIFLSVVFLLFYHFFAPVKYVYREKTWFFKKKYSYLEKIDLVLDLMKDPYNYDQNKIPEKNKDRLNILWRPSYDASALALVTSKPPYEVPFCNGETYIFLPKLIPRVLWPDKPTEDASVKFAIRYGLMPTYQKVSPFPLPVLTEMYMNFGEWGILFGMILLGILYNILSGYFNNKAIPGISGIYSIAVIFPFIYQEGNLTMTFGNIPLLTLSIYLICLFFKHAIGWQGEQSRIIPSGGTLRDSSMPLSRPGN